VRLLTGRIEEAFFASETIQRRGINGNCALHTRLGSRGRLMDDESGAGSGE
jgi:hypothetical protein